MNNPLTFAKKIKVPLFKRGFSSFTEQWKTPSPKTNVPQFIVGIDNGFLPRQDPLENLPREYKELDDLLNAMPLQLNETNKGLLATGDFGPAIEKELPEYDLTKIEDNRLLTALFRDYTFATSAYLLEPCDIKYLKEGKYGVGRSKLPRNLAVPLDVISKKLGLRPYMEYATSYALYNYARINPKEGLTHENLKLIRQFSGYKSETGFIITHVVMVRYTADLVRKVLESLDAVKAQNREAFNKALSELNEVMNQINGAMETMWATSDPKDYNKFRTFIMGTKNQAEMFPNGVVYEGVSDEPTFYRGESGANDSIIPTLDNLMQLTDKMPNNDLTKILKDFRTYRPAEHTKWLSWVEDTASKLSVRDFAVADPKSAMLYMLILDQIRDFRHRHWNFTKEYIIRRSKHPVATGGSPILSWLPNQLKACLDAMVEVGKKTVPKASDSEVKDKVQVLLERADTQGRYLETEVEKLKQGFDVGAWVPPTTQ